MTIPAWPKRHVAWAIFLAALLVRLLFLALVRQPPVAFDARRYTAVALAAPLAFANPSLWSDTTARNAVDFRLLYEDLIKDEDVDWFPYGPPSFSGALDDVFFTGPVYPLFLGTVFRVVPRYDFWAVRILQALLDAFSAVLIWRLMRRLLPPPGGLVAAGLWILYGPAIYKTGELNTETLAIVLGLLSLQSLVSAYERRQLRWMIGAGAGCAVLALTKAAAAGLIVPLLIAWIWINRKEWRWAWGGAAVGAVTAGVVIAPWVCGIHARFGTFGVRDPSYAGANFRNANILLSEGYNLDFAPPDFWTYPVWREMKARPLSYVQLYLRKFYRMWSHAADDFHRGFPLGMTGVLWMHRAIVLLALLGLLLWPSRAGPVGWLPVFYIGYFIVLHMVMHVVSRYNLVAMPLVCGAAVQGGMWLVCADRARDWARLWRFGLSLAVVSVVLLLLRPVFWLLLPGVSWSSAVWLYWLTGASLVAVGVSWPIRGVQDRSSRRGRVMLAAGTVLVMTFLTQAIPREGHAEWSLCLDRPEKQARRTITLPPWLVRDSVDMAFLDLDIVAKKGKDCRIVLDVDRTRAVYPIDTVADQKAVFLKPNYSTFLLVYNARRSEVRGWSRVTIDGPLLDTLLADRTVTLTLSAEPTGLHPGGAILYGDLPCADYARWQGPSFEYSSVERYYEGHDPRIWMEQSLEFAASRCELIRDGRVQSDDLSDRPGRQIGQYRMILALLMTDGRWVYL